MSLIYCEMRTTLPVAGAHGPGVAGQTLFTLTYSEPGEAAYRLGPLSVPGPGEASDAECSEAVRLFADRARNAHTHLRWIQNAFLRALFTVTDAVSRSVQIGRILLLGVTSNRDTALQMLESMSNLPTLGG